MCQSYAGEFETLLRGKLVREGLSKERSAARFRQSLDILLGKKKIYFQQPHTYFFPELPQIQFYEREDFPWLDKVEAATDDIRRELLAVLKDPRGRFTLFAPPVIQCLIFGYAASYDLTDIPYAVLDQDHSKVTRSVFPL